MKNTKITWDQDAEAVYIQFSNEEVAATITLSTTVYVDVDHAGNPVGMEVLRVDSALLATFQNLPESATLKDLLHSAA